MFTGSVGPWYIPLTGMAVFCNSIQSLVNQLWESKFGRYDDAQEALKDKRFQLVLLIMIIKKNLLYFAI